MLLIQEELRDKIVTFLEGQDEMGLDLTSQLNELPVLGPIESALAEVEVEEVLSDTEGVVTFPVEDTEDIPVE